MQPRERLGAGVTVALPERKRVADRAAGAFPDAVPGVALVVPDLLGEPGLGHGAVVELEEAHLAGLRRPCQDGVGVEGHAGLLDGVVDLHLPVGQMLAAAKGEDHVRHRDAVRTEPGSDGLRSGAGPRSGR